MGYAYGMTLGEQAAWFVVKSVCFILASFVFSFIFWVTKRWIDGQPVVKKKKK